MPICADCKWGKACWVGAEFRKCRAPKTMITDPVTGRQRSVWDFCSTHRGARFTDDHDCGREGRFWEPKERSAFWGWLGGLFR